MHDTTRRGFLRLALSGLAALKAVGVPAMLTAPVERWWERRWTQTLQTADGPVEFECYARVSLAWGEEPTL